MSQLVLNVGSNANDGTGDTLRDAMIKVNTNFTEVYGSAGFDLTTIQVTGNEIRATRTNDDIVFKPAGAGAVVFPALRINGNNIEGTRSNEDINLVPSGTGNVVFGAIQIAGTTLSSTDSTSININEGLIVDGTLSVSGSTTFSGSISAGSGSTVGNITLADGSITDSSGASGTIVKADIATATSSVSTTATTVGEYTGIRSLVGEDLNRIQDSYYYQDYSYEVKIGEAFSTYVNELKRAVHPSGFQPFGKVSIASEISVVIKEAGSDLAGFSADFSSILASALETIFDQLIQRRIESPKTYEVGSYREQIVYENGVIGGDKLVLDATSSSTGSTTTSDVSIILEDSLQPSNYDYSVNYIILNASDEFGSDAHGKVDVESGSFENEFENILTEDIFSLALEDTGVILLNGTDSLSSNENDKILIDGDEYNDTIILEDGFLQTGASILFETVSDYGAITASVTDSVDYGNLTDTVVALVNSDYGVVETSGGPVEFRGAAG